jgi:hypothetical protein
MKPILLLVILALSVTSCSLPITRNHPDFGPHYGDGH